MNIPQVCSFVEGNIKLLNTQKGYTQCNIIQSVMRVLKWLIVNHGFGVENHSTQLIQESKENPFGNVLE